MGVIERKGGREGERLPRSTISDQFRGSAMRRNLSQDMYSTLLYSNSQCRYSILIARLIIVIILLLILLVTFGLILRIRSAYKMAGK